MAFGFDQAIDQVKEGLGDLTSAFGYNLNLGSENSEGRIYSYASILPEYASSQGLPWTFRGQDWYKIFGYQFVVKAKVGNNPAEELIYTLPIPPQSFGVRMVPASQATPTFGGVVEETSANVFWLINLAGTTGIAVSREDSGPLKRNKMAKQFRETIGTTGLLSGALAGVNSAINKIGGSADALIGVGQSIANGNVTGVTGGLVGAFNTTFLPPMPYSASAVQEQTNGYTEMQELHRFLFIYSKLKEKNPSGFSLSFRCYKTNQEWQCVIQDFGIQQSAANPMLYRYNIALKGWNVQAVGKPEDFKQFDRFAPGGDLQSVNLVTPEVFQAVQSNIFGAI